MLHAVVVAVRCGGGDVVGVSRRVIQAFFVCFCFVFSPFPTSLSSLLFLLTVCEDYVDANAVASGD